MDEQMDLRNSQNLKNCSTFLLLSIRDLTNFLCLDLYIDVGQQLHHNRHNRIPPGCLLHENLCYLYLHNM